MDMASYMLNRYHARRAAAIEHMGGKCVRCGSVENLEFDHIDPSTKSFTIGKGTSFSDKRFVDELHKCQLLCQCCHKKKTSLEKSVPHGGGLTGKRYCKCKLCREKKNEYMRCYKRERRAKLRAVSEHQQPPVFQQPARLP